MREIEKIIRESFKGIESIEFEEGNNAWRVATKNVFTNINTLADIKEEIGAKNIEVSICAFRNARLVYTIYM